MTTFNALETKSLLKTLWKKGENAGYQHFLLFPQCSLTYQKKKKK